MAPLLPTAPPEVVPWAPIECPELDTEPGWSLCTIESIGDPVTLWSRPDSRCPSESRTVQLQLAPESHVIIGRANGGEVPYLDPRFVPSPIMPGTGKTILRHGGAQRDTYVSRAHFMLRGTVGGILLVNGVPRRGGGIRPPRNFTDLLEPQRQRLRAGEQLPIERGFGVRIELPNGTRLVIRAG